MTLGQATFRKESILVVDNAPDNLRLLMDALTIQGYSVRCAKSGALALSGSQVMPPDLVLLDVLMPQMNGYEVCKRLKQSDKTCNIPVIFLSAVNDSSHKTRAFDLGGADYIAKPFNIEEVLARIKYQLTISRQHQQLRQVADEYRAQTHEAETAYIFLKKVLDSLTEGIAAYRAVRDGQGNIINFERMIANSAFLQLLGINFQAPAATTASLTGLVNHLLDHPLFQLYRQALETQQSLRRELLHRQGDKPTWLEVFATKLQDGVVARLRDINETKAQIATLESVKRELYALATTDSLTQIANRYCFDAYLETEWQRSVREQQPLSLLIGDIDKFKRYNDLCGHTVGDRCLQAVAGVLRLVVKRPADLVARYGGEEFAVLLPNTPLSGALQIAETIQISIRTLSLDETQIPECQKIRLSLGVACTIPPTDSSASTLVMAADRALYQAKAQGGDTHQVEIP